jgi:hypothetical protein
MCSFPPANAGDKIVIGQQKGALARRRTKIGGFFDVILQ